MTSEHREALDLAEDYAAKRDWNGAYNAMRVAFMNLEALHAKAGEEGWLPIGDLSKEDGYVLGWSERDDGVREREYFFGRLYDIRKDALVNEWTGRWRAVTHWRPMPAPPATRIAVSGEGVS
jgi:hypothetical protein